MEFKIDHEFFAKAISDVNKAVSLKSPFPILTGIQITAREEAVILIGTNSDIIIEKIIATSEGKTLEILNTGSVVVSAKYISELVRKLSDRIHVKVSDKQIVTIKSGEIITNLNGFSAEEYPDTPQMNAENGIRISCEKLIESIKQTAFAASKSEARPVLTGVCLTIQENHLTVTATNSHRLARSELAIDSTINGTYIVPSSSLNELVKLMSNETGNIQIFVSDSYIVFQSTHTSLYSRLIEGNYPNTSGLIPTEPKTTVTLDTHQLLKGIDRACLFSSEWKNNNVHLKIETERKLKLSSASTEVGKIEETQSLNAIEGELELAITMDGSFLMDALKAIKETEVSLSFSGTMRPVLIQPKNTSAALHLISPVRT